MTLAVGRWLGSYEILSPLGSGGMGEVYRARDTKLARDVALKILTDAFALDAERIARFKREAQVLASLNHPHIGAIYGFEDGDGVHALVLELVDGPTLADRITQGPMPIDEALPIAKQIAEALEAAHEQGIVHRDLKPANIKVRADGTVKILDFGLAKLAEPTAAAATLTQSPTITTPAMTAAGFLLGTAAYMSPEQARGKAVDRRADVWSFGAVLYEMLTGRRAFPGDDMSEVIAATLRADPDWSALPSATSSAIRRLLYRCLDRDVRSRLSNMAMVRLELRDAETEPRDDVATVVGSPRRGSALYRLSPYAMMLVIAVVGVAEVWRARTRTDTPRPILRFSYELPDQSQLAGFNGNPVAISPDGSRIVYVANGRLYVRALDQLEAVPIAGTEAGGAGGFARTPFFSADGQWIGFWQSGQLRKVSVSGGASATICENVVLPLGASWGRDGRILWGAGPVGVQRVSANGGAAETLIALKTGERAATPQLLPEGGWVLFVRYPPNASIEQGQAVVQSQATGEQRVLLEGIRDVRYLDSGHLVYGRSNQLLIQAFDPRRGITGGEVVSVLNGVANSGSNPSLHYAVSSTGTLVYVTGSPVGSIVSRLVAMTRSGVRSPLVDLASMAWFPRFSPDGSRVAVALSAGSDPTDSADLWVLDARGARTRVTFSGNNRYYPIWTRDGTRLTFAAGVGPANHLLSAPADGSGRTQTLLDIGTQSYPTSWSADGKTLALYTVGPTRDIAMLRIDGDKRTPKPFIATPFEERGAIFSPDGRWVAYVSNKSGRNDIYASPYPGPGDEVTISVGGEEPVWGPSGTELFYRHDGKLLMVHIDSTPTALTVGPPKAVFDDPYEVDIGGSQGGMANYDISPDGTRFVMVEVPRPVPGNSSRLQIVVNWAEELKRLVPRR
jgi:serine/threonine-protein kinase